MITDFLLGQLIEKIENSTQLEADVKRLIMPSGAYQNLQISIINKSESNSVIKQLTIYANDVSYELANNIDFSYDKTTFQRGMKTTERKKLTTDFPFTVKAQDCIVGWFGIKLDNTPPIPSGKAFLIFETHKGKVKQEIELPSYSKMPVM